MSDCPRSECWSHPDAIANLLGLAKGSPERAIERWRCCDEVVRNLGEYRPYPVPDEPLEVRALRKLSSDSLRAKLDGDDTLARSFGDWRRSVADWEARNAARLQVLAHTLHTLIELRDYFEPETVDQTIAHVGEWCSRVWRGDVPLSGDVRAWCTRMTWNFDVLPKNWRRV